MAVDGKLAGRILGYAWLKDRWLRPSAEAAIQLQIAEWAEELPAWVTFDLARAGLRLKEKREVQGTPKPLTPSLVAYWADIARDEQERALRRQNQTTVPRLEYRVANRTPMPDSVKKFKCLNRKEA